MLSEKVPHSLSEEQEEDKGHVVLLHKQLGRALKTTKACS